MPSSCKPPQNMWSGVSRCLMAFVISGTGTGSSASRLTKKHPGPLPSRKGGKAGWVRGLMYRPVTRAISIRLPAPDIALAHQLEGRKGLPYQTYIKQLLHDALDRERGADS